MNSTLQADRQAQSGAGALVLRRAGRALWFGGASLALDPDGYAVLTALLEQRGATLPEAALLARVAGAPHAAGLLAIVGEVNAVLERASARAGFIAHYPEHGYALELPPARPAKLIGRAEAVAAIGDKLAVRRFVSIVGPGGIGKTSVARALAEQSAQRYPDGCIGIDLAPLSDPGLLPAQLLAALGMRPDPVGGAPYAALAAFLRGRRLLVLFDSCEHVLEQAGAAAEALLAAAPGVAVLATSREPLRADGEFVHRLGPIALAAAVRLFSERAFAGAALAGERAATVASLCRDLDCLPLALELAAALVAPLGLDTVAGQIGQRLLASAQPAQGVGQRHLSLGAMLDWSYHLLSPQEQAVFRRLSVFRAGFTLQAAAAVAGDPGMEREDVIEIVVGLIAKSLASAADGEGRHRLLDTTRCYAANKLASGPGLARAREGHARYLCALLYDVHLAWSA